MNVTNDGLEHVAERHFDTTVNASQFTISESDLANILQRREKVSTSVSRVIEISDGLRYMREIIVRRVIGADKFNNFEPTSILNVVADEYVNLVSAFPGGL
ncbi:adhesin [Pandoraea pnomenusa]|nr:adhesin [Pandoraea pnomenusa]